MADQGAEQRRLIEGLIQQQLDAAAAQRGWDLGPQAQGAQESITGAPFDAASELQFSTGYDGAETTVAFTFDFSTLAPDGTDILL